MQMSVVLPAPLGPSRTRSSFSSMLKSRSLRMVNPDTLVVRPLTSSRFAMPRTFLPSELRPWLDLEHDPEKWVPVFGKRSCSNMKLEQDDDSATNHSALLWRI